MQGEDPSQLPWQRNAAAASNFHAAPPQTPRANSSFRSRPTIKPKLVLELKMVWRHEKMKSKPFAKRSSTRGWTRWIRHPTLFAEPHRTRYHGPCRPPNAWLTQGDDSCQLLWQGHAARSIAFPCRPTSHATAEGNFHSYLNNQPETFSRAGDDMIWRHERVWPKP